MGRRFVILDDDDVLLDGLRRAFPDSDNVIAFDDAHHCIDYVVRNPDVDGVFVDLNMPDLNGVTWQLGGLNVIQSIKVRLKESAPFLCVMTSMDAVVHIHTCLKNGADGFVEKAHDVQDLANQILQVPRTA